MMREEAVEYVHLPSGSEPPTTTFQHRRVIVVIEQEVYDDWQDRISDWIAASGCLCMMAWGRDCSSWDDSVDHANLVRFGYREIPDENFIMTTWHDDEPLSEVFFYNQMCAFHPTIDLPLVTILHISETHQSEKLLREYRKERLALENDSEPVQESLIQKARNLFS